METYRKETFIPVSAEALFAWHMRPGALDELIPPWQSVDIVQRPEAMVEGAQLVMQIGPGPVKVTWVALHCHFIEGRQFVDVQTKGPFKAWTHTHSFVPTAEGSILRDRIEYELPLGRLGKLVGSRAIRAMIDRMFAFRHQRTHDALTAVQPSIRLQGSRDRRPASAR